MDAYQDKLNFSFSVNQQIIRSIVAIDSFNEQWKKAEKMKTSQLKELLFQAAVESTGASVRIEGGKISSEEFRELLNNPKDPETRDNQEALGYYGVLNEIAHAWPTMDLSRSTIQQLHKELFKYIARAETHRGSYKTSSNRVIASYADGSQKVIFNTTEPHQVEQEMFELLDWTNRQFEISEIHPLLVIGLFVFEILSIHPFQDGNGRISSLLANFLLLKNKYSFMKYVSFEQVIEQKKKLYYEVLMEGQQERYTPNEKIHSWILFFLDSIMQLTQKLEKRFGQLQGKAGYLNDRQKRILTFIEERKLIKLADIAKNMPYTSVNTLKKDLQYLKSEQLLDATGKNRGTVYSLKEI